jgi:F-type H+-transporting ATPase subunit alpha
MKKVAGTLKISLAQYRDMEAFAMFASDLDEASKRQLERGARLMELLRQPQYSPMPMAEQVAVIWAGTTGQLDEVPVEDVQRFEAEFLDHLRREGTALAEVGAAGKLDDAMLEQMVSLMGQFKGTFRTASGLLLGELHAEPVNDDDIQQQKIVKQKRG